MAAGVYNIELEQGTTFDPVFRWLTASKQPVDLTGYYAEMHVRTKASAQTTVVELSSAQGSIVLVPLEGRIQLLLSASETAAIAAGRYTYDLELVSPGGIVKKLLKGDFIVSAEVTRT